MVLEKQVSHSDSNGYEDLVQKTQRLGVTPKFF